MTSEIPTREFGQRFIVFERLRRGHSFLEQRVRKLFACSWATANKTIEFGPK
jgi:hypothetical protein